MEVVIPKPASERTHITCTPGILGGKPCIAGTRIRVQDIYIRYELQGMSADQIVNDFPQLTLADVHAALTYFWDHRDEILAQMKAGEEAVEQLRMQ